MSDKILTPIEFINKYLDENFQDGHNENNFPYMFETVYELMEEYYKYKTLTKTLNKNSELPIFSVTSRFLLWYKQLNCKHKKFDCDIQIRTIQCKKCGKRAWIDDYRILY